MTSSDNKYYITLTKDGNVVVGHEVSLDPPGFEQPAPADTLDTGDQKSVAPETADREFWSVLRAFGSAMESYRQYLTFTLEIAPALSAAIAGVELEKFSKRKGRKRSDLSSEKRDVYEMATTTYREFILVIEKASAALNGAKHLPEVLVVGLISIYDAFLSNLLRSVIDHHPEIVLTSEKNIKFSDLSQFSSIEDARRSIIDREVESVIRESHHEQFSWMERKFSMHLRKGLKVWPTFIEVCERRNLLTHTGGVVSQQYIQACKDNGLSPSATEGSRLVTDAVYFRAALQAVYEVGIKLGHTLWRKFAPEEREKADRDLNERAYDLIFQKQYDLAETLLVFGCEQKQHSSESARRMMVVNLANCLRLKGDKARANSLLGKEDWTAVSPEFVLCVAAVREEVPRVVELMREMGADGPIRADDYRTWPTFRGVRDNPAFSSAFADIFLEPLVAPGNAADPEDSPGPVASAPMLEISPPSPSAKRRRKRAKPA